MRQQKLHPDTEDLVNRFSVALKEKLLAAQVKYGYSNSWRNTDWLEQCRDDLRNHVEKGDPLDVAAYCAFLWHHGEGTVRLPGSYDVEHLGELVTELHVAIMNGHPKSAMELRRKIIGTVENL
jgi:hypothetical protein